MDIEQEAIGMGWRPKEEFKGNPDNWRPAEEYVDRGKKLMPILNDRVKKLEEDLQNALKIQTGELAKVKKQGYEMAKSEFEKKEKELDVKELAAVEAQDVEEFAKVKKERAELKEPEPVKNEPVVNPVFEDWNKKNTWYGTDPDLTEEANVQFNALVNLQESKTPGVQMAPDKLYAELTKRVKTLNPEKFENPHRKDPAGVESGTPSEGKKGDKFTDLPASAKSAYERQKKMQKEQGREFTKEQYLEIYNEE